MDLIVNNERTNTPAEISTWGELLDWVETRCLRPGQCITRVAFEGREEIHYRKSTVCNQGLAPVSRIDIDSADFDSVVRESLAELDKELRSALDSTREIVRNLENREEELAYNNLVQLLDSVRIFYTLFSEDLGWVDAEESARVQQTSTLENAIRQLIVAQETRSWVSICDVLEYELTPILENWTSTVEKTRARVN